MAAADVRIGKIADRQYGTFTYGQALSCGCSPETIKRRVREGRWRRLHRGVYLLVGAALSFEARAFGAVLAAGPGAALSHRSSGALLGIEGFARDILEVTVPRGRRAVVHGVELHHTELPRTDITSIARLRTTTPARTIIDLASVLDDDRLEDALHSLVRRRIVDPRAFETRLGSMERRGRRGIGRLRKLVRGLTSVNVSGSGYENKVRRLLVRSGLEEPVRQFVVTDEHGNFVARPDLSYPAHRVYIEYDGRQHMDPKQRARDLDRQNELSSVGWRPLVVIDEDFKKPPAAIVAKVRRALRFS